MKRNIANLMKVGVVVPALVLSLAACGSSASDAGKSGEAAAAATEEAVEETTPSDEAAAQQTEPLVYENGGLKITVPADLADKITVNTPQKSEDSILFDAYETASVEADKAMGHENEGGGWLFSICTRNEEEVHRIYCDDMSGEEVIGVDDKGVYYVFYHPSDVRYVRESNEQMEKDQDQWARACEWADSVRDTFTEENTGITKLTWSKTMIESYLARTCYQKDAKYTLSTTEFGPLDPDGVDSEKYFKLLTTDAAYERLDGVEAPDGEYVVLNFPDDDIRFDFFIGEGHENYIRQVWNNEENEELYKVTFTDESKKASEIMQEWYDELAVKAGKK